MIFRNRTIFPVIIIPIVLILTSKTSAASIENVPSTLADASSTDSTIVSANAPHRHSSQNDSLNFITVTSTAVARNFFIGNSTGLKRIHRERIEYYPIPWMRREKVFEYKDEKERIIKAIYCYDYKRTEADVDIMSGGIGFTHVKLLFISAPSYGLDFAIEIFA